MKSNKPQVKRLGSIFIDFDDAAGLRGNTQGKKMFIVTLLCKDQDLEKSAYSAIYRADSMAECKLLSKELEVVDAFGNTTQVASILEVGKLR